MKFLVFAAIALLSVAAFAGGGEKTEYTCSAFQRDGRVQPGLRAPEIVSLPNDLIGGTTLAVKVSSFTQIPQPARYEALTEVSHTIETSEWTSESYTVSFATIQGLRATIQAKEGGLTAFCKAVEN